MIYKITDEDYPENPNVTEAECGPLVSDYMCIYGYNINLERSFPMISDGLKPVMRRILYFAYKIYGLDKFKVGSMIGEVLKIHPHGDLGLGGVFARMAQPFTNNIPLLSTTETGNSGNATSGDDFAAPRYLDMMLSKFAYDVLFSEFDGKVNMKVAADPTKMEPISLPSKFPIVLLNGTSGIGWTISSDVPPYNLNEVAEATIKLIKNPQAKIHLVPDSPTGCDVIVLDESSFVFQSSFDIDNMNYMITIKNTPYMNFLDDIDKRLCEIQSSNNPIPEIISADDDSNLMEGKVRYQIKCKPCNLYTVLNKLFKRVGGFRSPISANNIHVVDNHFHAQKYEPRQILLAWIQNRLFEKRGYYLRRLVDFNAERNMLEGKKFMLSDENRQTTIDVISHVNGDKEEIIEALVKAFKPHVSTSQANAVADMKLYMITKKQYRKTIIRLQEVESEITTVKAIISDPEKIKEVIIDELTEIKKKYGFTRRSKILNTNGNSENKNIGYVQILNDGSIIFSETDDANTISSDIIPISGDEVCLIDDKGRFLWVDVNKVPHDKQLSLTSIGKVRMSKCVYVLSAVDHNFAILTNEGKIKCLSVSAIPTRNSKRPLLPLNPDETIVTVLELPTMKEDILVYTKNGFGKKISADSLNVQKTLESSGQYIINDGVTCGMFIINPNKQFLLYIAQSGRVRLNHSKYMTTSKKFGKPFPILTLSERDVLADVVCVNKSSVVKLYHADGRISTVNVDSLEPVTMQAPLKKPKHVPGVPIIRVIVK